MSELTAQARAHSNIALAKYWGKAAAPDNRTRVPSLSMTLEALRTTTRVSFDASLREDRAAINGQELSGRSLDRIVGLLNDVRSRARIDLRAEVISHNDFPTASGLASSASGFAALALAATRAAGLLLPSTEVSALARRASASAARSVFGGFVVLEALAEAAEPLLPAEAWPLEMLVLVTSNLAKPIGSSEGMRHTQATSPYFEAWVAAAAGTYAEIRRCVLEQRLPELGAWAEHSALAMHACMWAARPALCYWNAATLNAIQRVQSLRSDGAQLYFTIDAGPHVKVLVEPAQAARLARELGSVPGVERVIRSTIGPDASLVETTS